MKRVLSILISLCAIVSAYADVEIWTKDQLETFRDDVNNGNTYLNQTVKLMTDLDLGGTSESPISWEPIGKSETRWDEDKQESVKDDTRVFKGIFKGQGHTISMYVEDNRAVAGLFGYLYGTVQQLKVVGAISNSNKIGNVTYTSSTAGIAAYNRGTISECANFASIVGVYAGGIAGENHGIITNCYNRGAIGADATFNGVKYLGGIAGSNDGTGATISYVYASCSIDNVSSTGGITGNNISDGTVLYCYMASGMYNNGHGTTSELTGTTLNGQLNTTDDYTNWTFTDGELPELTCFKNKIVRLVNNDDNTAALSCNKGQTCTVELSGRTLYKDGEWNTICLPFELSTAQTSTLLGSNGHLMELDVDGKYSDEAGQIPDVDGAYQTGFDYESGSLNIYFKNATSIVAGKPYIIKWDSGDNLESHSFSNVTIANATGVPAPSEITSSDRKVSFIGNYSPVTLSGGDQSNLYLGTGTEGNETYSTLYYPSNDKRIYSCRAYFHVDFPEAPNPNELHIRVYFEDEEGLTEVKAVRDVHEVNGDTWYTSFGMKLEEKPSVPGVYIYNGRKVMIQ